MTSVAKVLTSEAPVVLKKLTGLICVNKPAFKSMRRIREIVATKICTELNELQVRPLKTHVSIVGDTSKELTVNVAPSFADNPNVIGPRYQQTELYVSYGNVLGLRSSGVVVLGINGAYKQTRLLRKYQLLRTYLLKGKLGECTDNNFADGRVLAQARYDFITRGAFDKVTTIMQAQNQKHMFNLCAVDGRSQTAYEMAAQGLLRPLERRSPLIYSIKCIDFTPPEFTVEVHCINETEEFLSEVIINLGQKLRTISTCLEIKCIRFSHFGLDDALLMKHWTLQNLLDSTEKCNEKLQKIVNSSSHLLVNVNETEDEN